MQSVASSAKTLSYVRAGKIIKVHTDKKTVDIQDLLDGRIIYGVGLTSPAFTYDQKHKEDRGFIYMPYVGDICIYVNVTGVGYVIINYLQTINSALSDNLPETTQSGAMSINTEDMNGVYVKPGIGSYLFASAAAFIKAFKIGRIIVKAATHIFNWIGGYETHDIDETTRKTTWKKAIYSKAFSIKELAKFLGEDPPGVYFINDGTTLRIYSKNSTSQSMIELKPDSSEINIYQDNDSIPVLTVSSGNISVKGNITLV